MTDLQKEIDALRAQLEQYGGRTVAEIEAAAVERAATEEAEAVAEVNGAFCLVSSLHEWAANRRKEAGK